MMETTAPALFAVYAPRVGTIERCALSPERVKHGKNNVKLPRCFGIVNELMWVVLRTKNCDNDRSE